MIQEPVSYRTARLIMYREDLLVTRLRKLLYMILKGERTWNFRSSEVTSYFTAIAIKATRPDNWKPRSKIIWQPTLLNMMEIGNDPVVRWKDKICERLPPGEERERAFYRVYLAMRKAYSLHPVLTMRQFHTRYEKEWE